MADGAEGWHPEGGAPPGVAEVGGGAGGIALARLAQGRDDAEMGGERAWAVDGRWVAGLGDDAGGALRSDAVDGGEQLSDLVGVGQVLDVGQAPAPEVEILADVAGLQRAGRPVMPADGARGGLDQVLGEFRPDRMPPVAAELRRAARGGAGEGACVRILGEQAGGEHAVGGADVAGELGEAEVDETVELADAVIEALAGPVAVADQFAQVLGDLVVRVGGRRAFLEGEAGRTWGVDGVGLGALEAGLLQAAGNERVDQRALVAGSAEHGEEVLPGVAGGLEDDEGPRGAKRREQRVVARAILGDGDRPADWRAGVVEACQGVGFGRDVDAGEHRSSLAGGCRGASIPAFMPALVRAETRAGKARPRDTVRARNAGRGRQSHARGTAPACPAAPLSQPPARNPGQGARR